MNDHLHHLLDAWTPHGHCYRWDPLVLWLHNLGHGITALAYALIPLALIRLYRARDDWPARARGAFAVYAVFIACCGATHVWAIVTTYRPHYRVEGWLLLATGLVSVAAVVVSRRAFGFFEDLPTSRDAVFGALSTESFRLFLDSLPVGVTIVGPEGRLRYTNDAAVSITGWTLARGREVAAEDWVRRFSLSTAGAPGRPAALEELPGFRAYSGDAAAEGDVWIGHLDREGRVLIRLRCVPYTLEGGEVALLSTFYPVGRGEALSHLGRAEAALERAQGRLATLLGEDGEE